MNFHLKKIKTIAIALCAFAAALSLFFGVNAFKPEKAVAAEAVVVPNADFEIAEGGKPTNWVTTNTTESGVVADVRFSLVGGDEAYSGKSLKVVNNSGGDIRGVLDSAYIPVKKKTTYLLSYYYRSESTTASSAVCARQFKSNKNDTRNNAWNWLNDGTFKGQTDGWQKVSMMLTTESDAYYIIIRVDISVTGESPVYYDNFSIEEIENTGFNAGMEQVEGIEAPLGWTVSNLREFSFDKEVYYDGKTSAHIVRNNFLTDFTMTSTATLPVRAAAYYDVGYRIKSQNSNGVKATVTANFRNSYGSLTKSLVSSYVYLKSGEGLSDWTDVWLRYIAPTGSTQVGITITVGKGAADCYIDGVFCKESGDVVYTEKFESISDSGLPDGFIGEAGTFTDGKLVLGEKKQASVIVDTMFYSMGYTMTGKAVTDGNAKPVVELNWLDYNGKNVGTKKMDVKIENGEFLLEFTMPKATTCELVYKNEGSGTVSFDDIKIEKTFDPNSAGSGWEGKWICYPYTDVGGSDVQYRFAYYRKAFNLTEKPVSAKIQFTGDDVITAFVNGHELEDPDKETWASVLLTDIAEYLNVGDNILAFRVKNETSVGGLLFDLELVFGSGKKMRVVSDKTVVSRDGGAAQTNSNENPNEAALGDWTALSYDETGWSKESYVHGAPPCQPWGEILYKKSGDVVASVTVLGVEVPEKAVANEKFTFSIRVRAENETEDNVSFKLNFRNRYVADEDEVIEAWLTPLLVSGVNAAEWKKGEEYVLKFEVDVPDYLESDDYMLQFDSSDFALENVEYDGNILRGHYFTLVIGEQKLTESRVVKENGRVQLLINGEKVAPMMYLREQKTVFKTEYASGMYGADVNLMCLPNCRVDNMNSSGSMWLGYGKYDFSSLDGVVYETLQGAPGAKLMLMLDADPPTWWLKANPDAYSVDSTGKKTDVSFASEKWREDMGVFYQALLKHVLAQPYAGHIFAVKIGAGATFEWQYYGQTLDTCADFGADSLKGFRKWLKEKYVTEAALRNAWGKSDVTFENAAIPTMQERRASSYETLLDGKSQRNVIDFHSFMCDATTDSILYFSRIVKEATDGKWIVGTYNGYITPALTYESAGLVNASFSRILASSYVDFLCSPICYDERQLGMSASYMMMVDTVIAAGKLPIIECDSRTVYHSSKTTEPSLLGEWGKTYTLKNTIEALKRDFANMMIKGAGLWWYDMYGGWFNDPEIYSMFKTANAEWNRAINKEIKSSSRIAFVVGDDIATTLAYSFDGTYHYLYQALYSQKESLAHIGAPYDMLYLSDVEDGLDRDYDVYLIVAMNVTAAQREGINKHLKKNGKTIIWVGAPGIYGEDGSMTAENVSALTGINLKFAPVSNYGITMVETETFTKGLGGKVFGNLGSSKVKPMLYVEDDGAEQLGTIYNSTRTGLAVKPVESSDGGYYFSIYSAVGNIPAEFIANVLDFYGVNLLDGDDVVFRNDGYVSIASPYGGKHTVKFDEYVDVYDVFKGEYVAKNVKEIEIETEAGKTILYRTEKHSDATDPTDSTDSSGGSSCKKGCNSSANGASALCGLLVAAVTVTLLLKRKGK